MTKVVRIIINGKKETILKSELSFEDLVSLAGQPHYSTVQYTKGKGDKPSGVLLTGQSVILHDGMVFDVVSMGVA